MPWDPLTDEQRELRDLVRSLARERIAPRAAEIDESHEFPWDVVELFREHELFGLLFDEEWGGTGTGTLLALVAIEEISKVCATSGLILAVQELGSLGLKLAGTQEQKERYLPRLALGRVARRLRADRGRARAPTRPRCARPRAATATSTCSTAASASSRTRASPTSTPSSRRPTRTPGHAGISAFVVEADAPGFEVARLEPKLGISGSTTGELVFDGCRVPAENLLGEEGEGFRIAMRILDRSRPGIAAQGLGIAQGATDYALEYAKTRETMGKPIAAAPADRGEARRHGDGVRGGARPPLPLRPDGRRRRARRGADEGLGDGQALLHRRRDGGDDRGGADPRRLRLHQGVPGRAHDARREDHADLRGHERDPAARDRARDARRSSARSCSQRFKRG